MANENELKAALYKDIIAVLEKHRITLDRVTNFNIDYRPVRSVIEFGESYKECLFTIQFEHRALNPVMTAEDEIIFVNSFPHPRLPNMRKVVDYSTGETSITIDAEPIRKPRSKLPGVIKRLIAVIIAIPCALLAFIGWVIVLLTTGFTIITYPVVYILSGNDGDYILLLFEKWVELLDNIWTGIAKIGGS